MPNTDMSKQTLTLFQEQQLSRAKLQDKPHATLTVLKPTACTDQVPFSFPSFCRKIFFFFFLFRSFYFLSSLLGL